MLVDDCGALGAPTPPSERIRATAPATRPTPGAAPGQGVLAVVGTFGPFDVLSDLAHELYTSGRADEAVRAAHGALVLVVAAGDDRTERYLRYTISLSLIELGRWAEAADQARVLLRSLVDVDPSWRAKALSVVAMASLRLERSDHALDALAEAYSLVQASVPVTYPELSAVVGVAIALSRAQLFEPAEALFTLALRSPAASTGGSAARLATAFALQELAIMDTCWALALVLTGERAQARLRYVVAAQLALRMLTIVDDDAELTGRALAIEAFAIGQLGEAGLAASRLRAATVAFELRSELPDALIARLGLGDALVALGQLDDARVHAEAVVEAATGNDRLILQLAGLAVLSGIEVAQHGDHPAIAHLRESRRLTLRKLLADRHSQFLALRDRVRVRDLADRASRLSREAVVDPLTGLGNRRMLDAGLEVLSAGAALWVDIDNFKAVNDEHSYAVGDAVLQQVAHLLRSQCRTRDVVVRYGGDEFVVLLPDTRAEAAAEVGERVRCAVADAPWGSVSDGLAVTVSVGAAEATGLDLALRLADEAVHGAKRSGRDQLVVRAG